MVLINDRVFKKKPVTHIYDVFFVFENPKCINILNWLNILVPNNLIYIICFLI
jgi:hypothetical protein